MTTLPRVPYATEALACSFTDVAPVGPLAFSDASYKVALTSFYTYIFTYKVPYLCDLNFSYVGSSCCSILTAERAATNLFSIKQKVGLPISVQRIGRVRYNSAELYPPRSGPRRVRYQIPRLGLNRLDSDESTDIPS